MQSHSGQNPKRGVFTSRDKELDKQHSTTQPQSSLSQTQPAHMQGQSTHVHSVQGQSSQNSTGVVIRQAVPEYFPSLPPQTVIVRQPISEHVQSQPIFVRPPSAENIQLPPTVIVRPPPQGQVFYPINSSFVPPPPEKFLVRGEAHQGSPSHLPVNSTHGINTVHNMQPILHPPFFHPGHQVNLVHNIQQPLFQSVHKTYIPQHIYNEIPVLSSETKQYQVEQSQELNEADQRMLEQYQILYTNYLQLKNKNQTLQELLKNQKQVYQGGLINNRSQAYQGTLERKGEEQSVYTTTTTDVKQLAGLLMSKIRPAIGKIMQRRKQGCLGKLHALLTQQAQNIQVSVSKNYQETLTISNASNK